MSVSSSNPSFASKLRSCLAVALVALVGGAIAISLFGKPLYDVGPFSVRASIQPALRGRTVVVIPPLGSVRAPTHSTPLKIIAVVEHASVEDLKAMAIELEQKDVVTARMRDEARKAMTDFFFRLLALAFAGGAVSVFAFFGLRQAGKAAIGGSLNLLIMLAALGGTALAYHPEALRDSPMYSGGLRGAPWIVELAGKGIISLGEVDSGVQHATDSIAKLYEDIGLLSNPRYPNHEARILVISDIHNNTIGMRFAASLARLFDIDLALNAGDLTDFGTHFEADLAEQVARIRRPHVFVAGNHDSPAIIAALRQIKHTRVLSNQTASVAGFRVYGYDDPASRRTGIRDLLPSKTDITRAKGEIAIALDRMSKPPDIAVVHSNELAEPLIGKVPLVVYGHTHSVEIEEIGDTVVVNPGTTGASGIRYFKNGMAKDMSAVIVYMSKKPEVRVTGADIIRLKSPAGEFEITRRRFR